MYLCGVKCIEEGWLGGPQPAIHLTDYYWLVSSLVLYFGPKSEGYLYGMGVPFIEIWGRRVPFLPLSIRTWMQCIVTFVFKCVTEITLLTYYSCRNLRDDDELITLCTASVERVNVIVAPLPYLPSPTLPFFQRGLGRSPGRNRIWCILALKSDTWWH